MAVSEGFREFALEQLGRGLDVRWRRMFGGIGIYHEDDFFALLAEDTLYFKVDDETRAAYVSAGSHPFRPYGDEMSMNYFSVPAEVLEDADALARWSADAVTVARRAKAKKKTSPPRKRTR